MTALLTPRKLLVLWFAIALALGSFVLTRPSRRYAKPESHARKVFRVRYESDIEGLDWIKSARAINAWAIKNLMEGLVEIGERGEVRLVLASSFDVSEDRRSYVFHLREGVRWTDGAPLRASQFVDAWKRLLDPVAAHRYAAYLDDIEGAADYRAGRVADFSKVGVRAADDLTLEVRLAKVSPYFEQALGMWVTFPVREDLIARYGDAWTQTQNLVTLGPYRLKSWEHGKLLVMQRNEGYYGPRPEVDEIDLVTIPDDAEALRLFAEGKLEHYWPTTDAHRAGVPGQAQERSDVVLTTCYLALNPKTLALRDREAIAHAIDKTRFSEVLGQDTPPARSFVPESLFSFGADLAVERDLAKARGLYRGPKRLTLVAIDDGEQARKVTRELTRQLASQLGVKVAAKLVGSQEYSRLGRDGEGDIFFASWGADYLDPHTFVSVFQSGSNTNPLRWSNAEYDRYVNEAASLPNGLERAVLLRKALAVLERREIGIVPLFHPRETYYLSPRVISFATNPLGDAFFRGFDVQETAE